MGGGVESEAILGHGRDLCRATLQGEGETEPKQIAAVTEDCLLHTTRRSVYRSLGLIYDSISKGVIGGHRNRA